MSKLNKWFSLVFGILMFAFFNTFGQQDPIFSQLYASSIYLNPALSGLEHRFSVNAIHREQWTSTTPFQTTSLSIILPYHDKGEDAYHKGGFGLNIYQENAGSGARNTLGATLNGAYNIKINSTIAQNLTFGASLGIIQYTYGPRKWGSGYDIYSDNLYNSATSNDGAFQTVAPKIIPAVSAGFLYYYNAGRNIYAPGISFYLGSAFSHLTSPNEAFAEGKTSNLPVLIKVHSGLEIHVAKMLNLSPNFVWWSQGKTNFVSTGANFTYLLPDHDEYLKPTRLVFGASYRIGDAIIPQFGFGSKYYGIGLSYDIYTTAMSQSQLGPGTNAFEVSAKTTLSFSKRSKKTTKFHTPLM
ncbi:MAG: PorP/SprF family type IX secretion system membrane protein [Bacteroidota bacterium]|nr:PorP/SprF family type IX secretion system membrane protein [Bacteroidota bacterium]